MATKLEAAHTSLERVQKFDTNTLSQVSRLGEDLSFKDAVEPAQKIINFFSQFPIDALPELPQNQLQTIINNADSFYQTLTQIQNFDPKTSDAYGARNNLIENLRNQYQPIFDQLFQIIAYGSSRQRDFTALERDFRAAIQRSEDSAQETLDKLLDQNKSATEILTAVRKTAAEQGVSQEAWYFKEESDAHSTKANTWRNGTIGTAVVLGIYAILSVFIHKWTWLTPTNNYEALQLGISKILIFAVLAYMLILCAKNFLSHTHNAIVNKHRQNALLTFNSLVQAAGNDERRDIILTYAAACIFSPQETGYTRGGSSGSSSAELPLNIIQAIPKLTSGGTH